MQNLGPATIVVRIYQDAENVPLLVKSIREAMLPSWRQYEIIFVLDNSGDGCEEIIRKLVEQGMPVRLIVRKKEQGVSAAVLAAFREAKGDYLVCLNADLSHPPSAIPKMLEILKNHEAEFVIGSRFAPGGQAKKNGDYATG